MNSKTISSWLVLVAICSLWTSSAMAGFKHEPRSNPPKWSVSGFYGVASYALDDLNRFIQIINANVGYDLLDSVNGGTEFGARLTYHLSRNFDCIFTYTAFKATTGYGPLAGSGYWAEIDGRGSSFELAFGYNDNFTPKLSWLCSVGLSRIKSDGRLTGHEEGIDFEFAFIGAGVGPSIKAGIEYQLHPAAFLWLEGGYRKAETGTVEHNGQPWLLPDSNGMTFSYSGGFLHLGLRISSKLID